MIGSYTSEVPEYGSLMTVEEWLDDVKRNLFIDYDGFGHAVKDGKCDSRAIYPSEAAEVPEDATHIVWFNR